jgi:hypothetical protein
LDNIWFLFQIAVNIVLGLGLVIMWAKLKRPPQDDPRLSRGLQLLQSKISVLEDLSDRTDKQVEQLSQLIEQKTRQLQTKIFDAERQLQKVDQSMHRSLEVAEIFQDKIPHDEIIERQNTVKYVLAAQMSHQGHSIDEILQKVDLPREQVEFIAKVNRDELMFDSDQLPEWAKAQVKKVTDPAEAEPEEEIEVTMTRETFDGLENADEPEEWGVSPTLNSNFELAQPELANLKKLGDEFRQACEDFEEKQKRLDEEEAAVEPAKLVQAAHSVGARISEKLHERFSGSLGEKLGKKLMDSTTEFLSEVPAPSSSMSAASDNSAKASKFLPIQPEVVADRRSSAASPELLKKTKVHSPSRYENSAKMQVKEVPNSEIKKVLFPRIDLDDHLG